VTVRWLFITTLN